ncbi:MULTISPECIES: SUKH-3 domain-containing protein [Acinetobacter]|uniref:SUKH-3 domain-containing protein n=1 Tax=Acinetobacter TaxID=469 RepID=UPI00224B4F78|nr:MULTISPECIES: SUKH-3 domain-containing protein [Acinetobacter]
MQKSNFDLNDDIQKYLIQYGWYAERKIDIKSVIEMWKADNYRVFDLAIFFCSKL